MEVDDEDGFIQELVSLRRETYWETFAPPPLQMMSIEDEMILSNGWNFNCYNNYNEIDNKQLELLPNSNSFEVGFDPIISSSYSHDQLDFISSFNEMNYPPFGEESNNLLIPADYYQKQADSSSSPPLLVTDHEHHQDGIIRRPSSNSNNNYLLGSSSSIINNVIPHQNLLLEDERETNNYCKLEPVVQATTDQNNNNHDMGCFEMIRKNKAKKLEGQPSKNLMAERRRRKRLNDRLSMLRSVVPKISKMDRTSILGDTIDYMKELLERIKILRGEIDEMGNSNSSSSSSNQLNLMDIFKDLKSKEIIIRNTPKFDVERSNRDTRIEICCAGKPGLLLSTVTAMEALGLEIQQCVISCFNDFSMQASCSEELEGRTIISSEEIKQALFSSAGYGGRFL